MQWSDEGIIISTRRHGESSVIVELLTKEHGRHAGMVRGGRGKRHRPVLLLGNRVLADWKARLSEHLGMYALEPVELRAALIMEDSLRLLALQSVCALTRFIAEREPHPYLFEATELLIAALVSKSEPWQSMLVIWELGLLGELGYGLDLSNCASTGTVNDLIYVSPRSGRAVSALAGEPYKDKLLGLPPFLISENRCPGEVSAKDVCAGLKLTRYFLEKNMPEAGDEPLPRYRYIFEERFVSAL
ncbi:MAG: DNA repair protein RecO [Hyphomicrobiaceae bacterium]|nr:DNA repair protein RecO [Hyphomicrobiaceae bacterium]